MTDINKENLYNITELPFSYNSIFNKHNALYRNITYYATKANKRHNGYKNLDYLIYEFSIQNCLRIKKIILGSFIKMTQYSLWAK